MTDGPVPIDTPITIITGEDTSTAFTAVAAVAAPVDGTAAMLDIVAPAPGHAASGQVPQGWLSLVQYPVPAVVGARVVVAQADGKGRLYDITAQPAAWTPVPVGYGETVGTATGLLFVGADSTTGASADMPLQPPATMASVVLMGEAFGDPWTTLDGWASGIGAAVAGHTTTIGANSASITALQGDVTAVNSDITDLRVDVGTLAVETVAAPQIWGEQSGYGLTPRPVESTAVWRIDADREHTLSVTDRAGTADGVASTLGAGGAAVQSQAAPVLVVGGRSGDAAFTTSAAAVGDLSGVDLRCDVTPGVSFADGDFAEILTQTHDLGAGSWDNFEAALWTHDGRLDAYLEWTEEGGSAEAHNFFVGPVARMVDGRYSRLALRFTLVFDDGSGHYVVAIWRATKPYETGGVTLADGSRWTLIDSATGAGVTTIDTGVTEDISIGRNAGGGMAVHSLTLRDGVDGPLLVDVDPRTATAPHAFVDGQANAWTSTYGYAGRWDDPAWISTDIEVPHGATLDLSGDFTIALDCAPVTATTWVSKGTGAKFVAFGDFGSGPVWRLADGSTSVDVPVPAATHDVRRNQVLVVDRTANTATAWSGADVGTPVDISTLGAITTTDPLTLTHDLTIWRAALFAAALPAVDILRLGNEWRPGRQDPTGVYAPAVPANWTTNPRTFAEALDELAARV